MRRRGQSTVELAMVLPFVLGLLLLVLQVGILVSDQVRLDHFAYEGATWAIANPATATADPVGAPGTGTIAQHVYAVMCGGTGMNPPSNSGSRFCRPQPSGVPLLSVTVESRATPTALAPPVVAPTSQVLGKSQCKGYSVSVSPTSATISQGGAQTSQQFTVSVASTGGKGAVPAVNLNVSGFPPGLQVPPVFVPTQITPGQTSVATLQAGASTPPGSYKLSFDGTDNCTGATSSIGPAVVTLQVTGSGVAPSPSATPVGRVGITGILPGLICINLSSPITISGFGFQAGATVTTGSLSALSVSVVSSTKVNINTAALAAGIYNVTLTNPDGTTGSANSSLNVSSACSGGGTTTDSGTATSPPTATSLTDTTKAWTTNQFAGATVTSGGSTATVLSNNGTTLTLSGWLGGIPLPGPYTVQLPVGGGTAINSCASASGQYQTIITVTWYEPLVIPLFAPTGVPQFTLRSVQLAFCQ